MTSTRPYRRSMPADQALGIIEANRGSQFHAVWGTRFIKLGENGHLDDIVGHSEPGIPLQHCPMCGPTIVVSRHHRTGDHVYCRHCGGEAEVMCEGTRLSIAPTGRRGTIQNLEPEIDNGLLDDLVQDSSRHLAANGTT